MLLSDVIQEAAKAKGITTPAALHQEYTKDDPDLVTPASVWSWWNGYWRPSNEHVQRLAELLDLTDEQRMQLHEAERTKKAS